MICSKKERALLLDMGKVHKAMCLVIGEAVVQMCSEEKIVTNESAIAMIGVLSERERGRFGGRVCVGCVAIGTKSPAWGRALSLTVLKEVCKRYKLHQ